MSHDQIWDYFQNTEETDAFAESMPRYRYLAARLQPASSVLNIGVGRGGLESVLVASGHTVAALDPSARSIESLQVRLPAVTAKVGYSQAIPFPDESFDHVVMTEVLEHLPTDVLRGSLLEVNRVLRRGGRFVGTVPANEVLSANFAHCPKCSETFHRWGHVQTFSPATLKLLLEQAGFRDVQVRLRAFPDFQRKGLINFAKSTARLLLGALGSPLAQPSIYFMAAREQ